MTIPACTGRAGWRWDGSAWRRVIHGAPSVTRCGAPITAQTVVVLTAIQVPVPDPYTVGAITFLRSEGGTARVLRDGTSVQGRWHLDARGLPVVTGAGGAPIPIGSTLPPRYEVVPSAQEVRVTPQRHQGIGPAPANAAP